MDTAPERTSITFIGRTGPHDASPSGPLAGISFEGDISMADLRDALIEAGIPNRGGYALSRNTKEFNWGAYSLTEFFFVEVPQAVGEEVFWTGIGILVDKVAAKLRGSTSIPNASNAAHNAIAHILVAYPDESRHELSVVGDGVDMERKLHSIVVRSPTADYRVSLRTSPGGIVFAVASERLSRTTD